LDLFRLIDVQGTEFGVIAQVMICDIKEEILFFGRQGTRFPGIIFDEGSVGVLDFVVRVHQREETPTRIMGHFGRIKGDVTTVAVELAVSHVAQQHRLSMGREAPEDDQIAVIQPDIDEFRAPEIEVEASAELCRSLMRL
jgi:hypothetical protein